MAVGPDRLQRFDGPARTGVGTVRQQLVERALEGLIEHPREPFGREARRLEDDRPGVREASLGDLEHRRAGFELEVPGDLTRRELFGVEHDGARGKSEAASLLGKSGESRQVALDRRLGDKGAALRPTVGG